MENQDHKFTTPSGHEIHAPHLCGKCGWPFPNPHPSARHRRAHKKVCGKIEGYKLSESEADISTHSAVSDDEEQTPSPKGGKTSVKGIGGTSEKSFKSLKSYKSEDETFSDAVAEFSDSGISPGMEDQLEGVKSLSPNVSRIDDELLKADATGGISGSLNDDQHAAEVNDAELLECAINQSEAAKALDTNLDRSIGLQLDNDPIKSEIPVDAFPQEINAAGSAESKLVQMSSGQLNDLKGIEEINSSEGLADATVEVYSQSAVSDTNGKPSSYEQATDSVAIEAKPPLNERENPDSVEDLKLEFSEADHVKDLDEDVNLDKQKEQLYKKAEQDKQAPSAAPILESKANSSEEIDDGGSQIEFSEDVHVMSLAKDLPAALDNPDLLLQEFKDHDKFKSSFPLDLGSKNDDDVVAGSVVSQSLVDTGGPNGSISSVVLDVSGDRVSEENVVVSAEGKTDSTPNTYEYQVSSIPNSKGLKEPEEPLSADHSDMDTVNVSVVQEEGKQATKVDDPVIEGTETSLTVAAEENKESILANTSCLSEANQNVVNLGGSDRDEHEDARTEHPIVVAGRETEKEKFEETLARNSESDQTILDVGGHDDRAIVTDTTLHESKDETIHEVSKDGTITNDAEGLESKVVSDCDVKEPAGSLVDTDLNSRVISSPSQNDGNDKLKTQNGTVSAVDVSMTSSSRTDSLDANWGSVSVLSTQSESTAVPEKKPSSGAEECHPDKPDVFEPPSFMTLVESGESANKKATAANEIEPKTEAALKAGWFPSITNVVNESQGRKKNEEIIAKVTNWSSTGGKQQHTPLKNLLGEAAARSPNTKQVPPSANKKDETAPTKTTVNSILSSEAAAPTTMEADKEWNSPARYPVDSIKKEKRKTKPYWVPFVCCSSVHQDA